MTTDRAGPDAYAARRRRDARQVVWMVRGFFLVVSTMPFWLPVARGLLPLGAVGTVLDGMWLMTCHRLPERTLELAGVLMPVCSRCAGIHAGLALGAALMGPRITLRQAKIGFVVTASLMGGDVVMQDLGIHPLWHSTRLLTGLLLGWVGSSAIMGALAREYPFLDR